MSFAGFFPADNPRYTCIVCLKKSRLPASGGGMSGVVFHHIAEGVMAQSLKRSVDDARDSRSSFTPAVKKGDSQAANYVLASLKTKASAPSSANYREGSKHTVPDVTGMGAKDAVYLLESRRVKARIKGRGKVKSQSIHAGTAVKQGMVCELILD